MKALCKNPELDKKYGWMKNKAYGTQQHRNGIKTHGITEYHRKVLEYKQYAEPSDDEDNFE